MCTWQNDEKSKWKVGKLVLIKKRIVALRRPYQNEFIKEQDGNMISHMFARAYSYIYRNLLS